MSELPHLPVFSVMVPSTNDFETILANCPRIVSGVMAAAGFVVQPHVVVYRPAVLETRRREILDIRLDSPAKGRLVGHWRPQAAGVMDFWIESLYVPPAGSPLWNDQISRMVEAMPEGSFVCPINPHQTSLPTPVALRVEKESSPESPAGDHRPVREIEV